MTAESHSWPSDHSQVSSMMERLFQRPEGTVSATLSTVNGDQDVRGIQIQSHVLAHKNQPPKVTKSLKTNSTGL